ncbi:MAG: dinitrogenase iron-molybdenum cofactor biosynthesis protein [Veillonellaceae bacterium]|jgi:predicted Fe-Mo cluster-binding NifX family protein|nr:dinitrogenase iron-molybdenum cofactor biosynthesis protein [Veillonellaceae bacterium]
MRIAITSHGQDKSSLIDPRFGRAEYLIIHDTQTGSWEAHISQNLVESNGTGIHAARNILELGAEMLITGHVGPKAFRILNANGLKVYSVGDTGDKLTADKIPALLTAGKLIKLNVPNAIDFKK